MNFTPPLPESTPIRTVLVFGGAFDPPHRGHVDLPRAAREAMDADWLLHVPSAQTPLKPNSPGASAADRIRMLELAIEGEARASICDVEIVRGGISYTIDTLRELQSALPDVGSFRLLIGADQAAQFHRWRSPQELLRVGRPVVMLRTPMERPAVLLAAIRPHWSADEVEKWRDRILAIQTLDAASTDVRAVLESEGPDAPGLRGVIPGAVLDYIRRRGLYRSASAR